MNEWCVEQHGKSGLTQACRDSDTSLAEAEQAVLAFVQQWAPEPASAQIAGNSVHVDLAFLRKHMPRLVDHLHYRYAALRAPGMPTPCRCGSRLCCLARSPAHASRRSARYTYIAPTATTTRPPLLPHQDCGCVHRGRAVPALVPQRAHAGAPKEEHAHRHVGCVEGLARGWRVAGALTSCRGQSRRGFRACIGV